MVQKTTVYAMLQSPLPPWKPGHVSKTSAAGRLRRQTIRICRSVRIMGSFFAAKYSIAMSWQAKKKAQTRVSVSPLPMESTPSWSVSIPMPTRQMKEAKKESAPGKILRSPHERKGTMTT